MRFKFSGPFVLSILLKIFLRSLAAPQDNEAVSDDTSGVTDSSSSTPIVHPMQSVFRQYLDERKNSAARGAFGSGYKFDQNTCMLSTSLKREIERNKDFVDQILETVLRGKFRGKAWKELALFVELFPQRLPGSDVMERAMSFLGERMADNGLQNLKEEEFKIPVWSRGIEAAILTNPIELELNIRGLAQSVGTPAEGITAEVVVVRSFKEVEEKKEILKGRLVVFNSDDGSEELHLMFGPILAAKHDASGVLLRSPARIVTSSTVIYDEIDNTPKIPAAVISQDDADKLSRLAAREDDVIVHFRMVNEMHSERLSRNLFGDFPGESDEGLDREIVMVMSHSASWDAGEGAQDDGMGIIINAMMISVFKHLEIKPKRTIRNAIFTTEESGVEGTNKWVEKHEDELLRYSAVLEADMGCVKATGFVISGNHDAACIMGEIMKLYEEETGAKLLAKMEAIPSNAMHIHAVDVPTISLVGDDENSKYFEVKHTYQDSMSSIDPDELDKCLAVMASTAFVLANLEDKLPRDEEE